jgi:hypothetical protein
LLFNANSAIFSYIMASVVDRGFEPRSGQTKDYKIGICCFSANHAALRRKSKDGLVRNQNNVSEWSGNNTLIVPPVPTIFLGVASENSWYLGDNKSAITLIPSQ